MADSRFKLAIHGKMGSGKSTLAQQIQKLSPQKIKIISFASKLKYFCNSIFKPKHKNRELLVKFGMKMREIDPDIWVNHTLPIPKYNSWIIDDLRFPNELNKLKQDGWMTLKIFVPDSVRKERIVKKYGEDNSKIHFLYFNDESEVSLDLKDDTEFDFVLYDDGKTYILSYKNKVISTGKSNGVNTQLLIATHIYSILKK
jgi:adenylate kinase family enzyme